MSDFFTSKNINFNLYATYIIKKYIEINVENKNNITLEFLKNQISKEELIILTSLLNKGDKKLSYNILYILNNIAVLKDSEILFSLDENICFNIASFLGNNKKDDILLFDGVLLIRNLSIDKNVCDIFNKYKIIEFFEEIYERILINNKFIELIMHIICNIIHFELIKSEKLRNISCFIPCLKIFATQLRPNYSPSQLYKYIYKIYELCISNNDDIYYEIINCKIHKELMNIYPHLYEHKQLLNQNLLQIISSKNDLSKEELENYQKIQKEMEYSYSTCLIILKIFGKILFSEDGILIQSLLNANICSFLTPLIQSHDLRVIKNISFCISNICAGTYGQMAYLFKNNTFYELIKVSKEIYEAMELTKDKGDNYNLLRDTFREINFSFGIAVNNSNFESCVPFVKCNNYTVVFVLMKGLGIFSTIENQDLIEIILQAIGKLNTINYLFEENILDIMEKYGLKDNLEKILQNKHWKIFKNVEIIYDSMFGMI